MAERLFNNSRFNFVGSVSYGKEPLSTKPMGSSKWSKTRLGVGVKNDNNMQFLNMEYIHNDSVKTCKILGKDGETFEVDLNKTTNEEVVAKASDMVKITVDLETDFEKKKEYTSLIFKVRNIEKKKPEEITDEDKTKLVEYKAQIKELATNRVEFAHMKDAIKFVNASLPVIKDYKIRVTGTVKSNFYNNKNNLQYIPSFIEIVPQDTENQLKAYMDVFYEEGGIEDDLSVKKMFVNGYVGEKVKKVDTLFPLSVVIDYTKIDLENAEHQMLLGFMKDIFKITDKKQVHKIGVELNVINGSEVVEFDESCLTDQQRLAIQFGLNKIEDFKPRGNVYGEKIQELKVVKANLKAYPNGCKEVFNVDDLHLYLSKDDSDVKASDIKKEEPKEEVKEESKEQTQEEKLRALFG